MRGRSAVSQLFAEAKSGFVYPLRYLWYDGTSDSDAVLFSVPKRYHKRANRRNLLRRRTKEAYRLNKELLLSDDRVSGLHIALIYSSKEAEEYPRIERAVRRILEQIATEYTEEREAKSE